MKWKLFYTIVAAISTLAFLGQWYADVPVPAWQAAIWAAYAFITELNEYLEMKRNNDWS